MNFYKKSANDGQSVPFKTLTTPISDNSKFRKYFNLISHSLGLPWFKLLHFLQIKNF